MANRPKNIQYGTSKGGAGAGGKGPGGGKGTASGASGGSGRNSLYIVLGVVAAIVLITVIVIAAANDEGGETGNDIAYAPAKITGAALATMPEAGAEDAAVGTTIPTVAGQSFDGTKVTIEPGEPQVIAVIAHWCPHCQKEVPLIAGWQADGELPKGVKVVAVSTAADEAKGNFPPASWLEQEKWKNDTLVDTAHGDVLSAFGATGFPTLIAVTKDGKVAKRASGELTLEQVQDLFNAALGKDSGTTPDTTPEDTTPLTSPVPTNP